jgi:cobalt-precorrin 5A hydrolase/precorrin-3B C17-methyltransferase
LDVPLRFLDDHAALPEDVSPHPAVGLHLAATPEDADRHGRPRGRLSVVGLGPGTAGLMAPAVRAALDAAEDVLGYDTYVSMAGPFRPEQVLHPSDNREELQRAAHAFSLAAQGRRVAMVSSGDPGVFAMAAAVLEALENGRDPRWHGVELEILPGISAALAAAARAGAPLGHDCCLLSLSDNLKPWEVIERRLDHAAAADLAMAFYNPISRARPWQLGRALEVIARHRAADTVVVLGRDIGRPGERLTVTTLGELTPDQVDMRTLVIVGSTTTRRFPRAAGGDWVYTPRWYPRPPA